MRIRPGLLARRMALPDQAAIPPYFPYPVKRNAVRHTVLIQQLKESRVVGIPCDLAQVDVQHPARQPIPVADDETAFGERGIPTDARQEFMDRDHGERWA